MYKWLAIFGFLIHSVPFLVLAGVCKRSEYRWNIAQSCGLFRQWSRTEEPQRIIVQMWMEF